MCTSKLRLRYVQDAMRWQPAPRIYLNEYVVGLGGSGTIQCRVLAELAGRLQVSRETLYMIAKRHKRPSPELAIRIESATSGAVRCEELRPDVPWHVVRGQPQLTHAPEPGSEHEAA